MDESVGLAVFDGCYEASRAAALAGVPESTVYDWARKQIVTPSISPVREKLWSYADLLQLRIASWLRHPKSVDESVTVPRTPMREVRETFDFMREKKLDLWSSASVGAAATGIRVDRSGNLWIETADGELINRHGEQIMSLRAKTLELLKPFGVDGRSGPDLLKPRSHLRLIPAKVAGEPHVAASRITTRTLAALFCRGLSAEDIAAMYEIDLIAVSEAVDLEQQLQAPTGVAA